MSTCTAVTIWHDVPPHGVRLACCTRRGSGHVRPGTARRAVYRELATRPGPSGTYAERTRRRAAERGWPPPLRVAGRVLAGRAVETADELEAAFHDHPASYLGLAL